MPQVIPVIAGEIGAALFAAGVPLAAVNAAVGITLAGGPLVLSLALSGAGMLLDQPRGVSGTATTAALEQTKATLRQATPPQRDVRGQQRIGGALAFLDDSKSPYLYLMLLLSRRTITSVERIYINNTLVGFDSNNDASTAPYYDGSTVFVSYSFRDGDADQAIDPLLAADFPNLALSFRQRGIATIVFKMHYGADAETHQALWGNGVIPTIEILVKGAPIYDPREPTQDKDDESTWTYSANAALNIADWLRQPYGGRFSSDQIDWVKVAEAATWDGGLVGLKDGTFQPRYEIGGVASLDQSPLDVAQAMLRANRGFIIQDQGQVWVKSAKPENPVLTIHAGMLAGGFDFQDGPATKSLLNLVRSRFVAPDRFYQLADGPVLDRSDLRSADGQLLDSTIDLPWVQTHQRAQRIEKTVLDESRIGKTWSGPLKLNRLTVGVKAGDVVQMDLRARDGSELYPAVNGIYRIVETGFSEDFATIALSLVEYDKTIETDWDAATDEQDFVLADLDVS